MVGGSQAYFVVADAKVNPSDESGELLFWGGTHCEGLLGGLNACDFL